MKKRLKITEIAEKHIVSKLSKISIPNLNFEDFNEDRLKFQVPIFYTFREISRQKSVTDRPGRVGSDLRFK